MAEQSKVLRSGHSLPRSVGLNHTFDRPVLCCLHILAHPCLYYYIIKSILYCIAHFILLHILLFIFHIFTYIYIYILLCMLHILHIFYISYIIEYVTNKKNIEP